MGLAPCCGETPVAPRSGAAAEDRSQFMGPYMDILQDRSSCSWPTAAPGLSSHEQSIKLPAQIKKLI